MIPYVWIIGSAFVGWVAGQFLKEPESSSVQNIYGEGTGTQQTAGTQQAGTGTGLLGTGIDTNTVLLLGAAYLLLKKK
jgi:hypothetical protein